MERIFCLDARTVHPHFPGVGRYTANLVAALPACLDPSEQLVVLRDSRELALWGRAGTPGARAQIIDVPLSPFSLRQQWAVPPLLRHHAVSLYHSPYYLMPYRPRVPAVVTLHDLIPLRYPRWFTPSRRLVYGVAVRLAVRVARLVITVSTAAARDIEHLLRVPRERIAVIPGAADPALTPQPDTTIAAVRERLGIPQRYALYVGSNKPHKNLVRLVEAWARLRPADVVLVIAGAWDARFPEAQQRAATLGISASVRFIGAVAEPDLAALYSGAQLFVFPSECEGFGLPVIEAMACGTPVACSTAASLMEIAGDAALPFAPHDVDAMAAAIGSLLADADLRKDLSRRGIQRAAQFSWNETAHLTLSAYRRALE
jgi:glycosyltransferase involved in cell wall biosynthesis